MTSNDSTYSSERKLNFLCSLDLIPTPLIKNCPNATKRWLRAVPNVSMVADIGINAQYEIDHSPNKIDFIAVSMVDATENNESNLMFSNLSDEHNDDSTSKVTPLMNKTEHAVFEFDKEKCIYTFSDQCSMETLTATIPSYVSNGIVSQKTMNAIVDDKSEQERSILQNIDQKNSENNLMFSNMSTELTDDSASKLTPLISKSDHIAFVFDKEKCIYTFSDQYTMETLPATISPYISYGTVSQKTTDSVDENKCVLEKSAVTNNTKRNHQLQNISIQNTYKKMIVDQDMQNAGIDEIVTPGINQNIFTISPIGKPTIIGNISRYSPEVLSTTKLLESRSDRDFGFPNSIHSGNSETLTHDAQQILVQELPKRNKANRDLQEIVLNEIISQEINQTIFAKATIGKTQGYLSELLRTSKLLEDKSEKEYRRTRHNLEKIKQFLKKPKYERKRVYDEVTQSTMSVSYEKQHEKQKRTVLSDEVKNYLSNYFLSHAGKLCNEDYQLLSSHLKLDLQNVKIFHKNWKQRTKMKIQ